VITADSFPSCMMKVKGEDNRPTFGMRVMSPPPVHVTVTFPLCLLPSSWSTPIYKAGFHIVMRLGELHAWISVDGVELSEFAVEYSADGRVASCWIPSECDKVRMKRPTTLKSYS
jgi:hypothetical protein